MYGVLHGGYIGENFVYIKTDEDGRYHFLSIPSLKNIIMNRENFTWGIENNFIEKIQKLPKRHWIVLKEKYDENLLKNNTNTV